MCRSNGAAARIHRGLQGERTLGATSLLFVGIWVLVFGPAAAYVAAGRARRASAWFAFGAILGPIALVILRSAPPGHCPVCGAPVPGWLWFCVWCSTDFRPDTAVVAASGPAVADPGRAIPAAVPGIEPASTAGEPAHPAVRHALVRNERRLTTSVRTASDGTGVPSRSFPQDVLPVAQVPAAETSPPAGARMSRQPPTVSAAAAAPTTAAPPSPEDRTEPARQPASRAAAPQPFSSGTFAARAEALARGAYPPPDEQAREVPGAVEVGPGRPGPAAAYAEPTVLASGVYVGGSEALLPGCRYAVVRHGRALRIIGPLDSSPGAIRVEHQLEAISVTSFGERVVISDIGPPRKPFVAAFNALAGLTPEELERSLNSPPGEPAGRSAPGVPR